MIAYLDTHVVVWLAEGLIGNLSEAALNAVNAHDLRVSPFVSFELSLLFEKKRLLRPASAILRQLKSQIDVQLCNHPLTDIAEIASTEIWTREPIDRLIVAHARANNYSPLVSCDQMIRRNYPRTIW